MTILRLYEDVPVDASDLEVALSAATAGAAVIRAAYGTDLVRHQKHGNDFATQADLDSERAISAVIAAARPDDARVGEETGTAGTGLRRWLVDPLCGTLNFAAQTPLMAVNVALLDGRSELACVSADPIADEMFWTDGHGAFRRYDGIDEQLTPSTQSRLVDVNCDGPTDRPFLGPQLLVDPSFRTTFGPRVMSTTLALSWVAAGRRAGYVSDGRVSNNVHFAAGIGLCRSAGCVVTDLVGDSIESGRGLLVAADSETHGQLLQAIQATQAAVRSQAKEPE